MITAIIVDDETKGAKTLELLIHKFCPQVHVLGLYESVKEAREAIMNLDPQLVFLDIEMPFENGFHLLEQTKKFTYEVIFTTAYHHYAISAIKANALDYLLKPIEIEELISAVQKAEKRIENKESKTDKNLEALLSKITQGNNQKISLASHDGITIVDLNNIICFEADSNYTHVYLVNGKKITISKTLKTFEKTVDEHVFLRVHNSFIVNFECIERYLKGDGGTLIMKDGSQIPVSRAYKQDLLNKIGGEV